MAGFGKTPVSANGRSAGVSAAGGAQTRGRHLWRILVAANTVALVATVAGCFFMMRSQGVHSEVNEMRNEIGEIMTMMSIGGVEDAFAKYLPSLVSASGRWERRFKDRGEDFRGLDSEIDQVQAMCALGAAAVRWHRELANIPVGQMEEYWKRNLRGKVDVEKRKWPNRIHKKSVFEGLLDFTKDFWAGIVHGALWPAGVYSRSAVMVKGGGAVDRLDFGQRVYYILFPFRLSDITMLWLGGVMFATSAIGYLLCWIGLKTRFGWMSYAGLVYFIYLLVAGLFIVWLEVSA